MEADSPAELERDTSLAVEIKKKRRCDERNSYYWSIRLEITEETKDPEAPEGVRRKILLQIQDTVEDNDSSPESFNISWLFGEICKFQGITMILRNGTLDVHLAHGDIPEGRFRVQSRREGPGFYFTVKHIASP